MKVNAPEKIYIDRCSSFACETTDNSIEYVRADAFMKKAENFLEMLGYGFTITDNITHKSYDKEQLIEDFRNYIKR